MAELLCLKNVTKKYKSKTVLDNVSCTVKAGRIVGLLGRNGAGKTTIMKLVNDLLTPTSGEIKFKGKNISPKSKLAISYLPERTYLDRQMTPNDAVKLFTDFYPNFDADKALRLFNDLDLDPNQKLAKMSKGMQEKVQLVLVVSRKADLYVLDEPLGGVDPATRDYVLKTILKNFHDEASVLISTHIISDIEKILDDVIFIDQGKIILEDSADKLRKKNKKSIDEIFRNTFKVER